MHEFAHGEQDGDIESLRFASKIPKITLQKAGKSRDWLEGNCCQIASGAFPVQWPPNREMFVTNSFQRRRKYETRPTVYRGVLLTENHERIARVGRLDASNCIVRWCII